VVAALWPAPVAAGGTYAFNSHNILVQQAQLQYSLSHTSIDAALRLLGFPAPARPPVLVRCHGVSPVQLQSGAAGWYKIRCTTSLAIDDYLYTINSSGFVVTHRVNPNSP
jgi:hypothetical protein